MLLKAMDKTNLKPVFITGDFDIDLLKASDHASTAEFINNLLVYSFAPFINMPTRHTETSSTLLDNIL